MLQEPVLLSRFYPVFILLAALDVMLTWIVLHAGGWEVNVVAAWVIDRGGSWGMTFFKFGIVLFVLCTCEYIARKNISTARKLALGAIAINMVPVMVAAIQLAAAAR